MSGLRRRSSDAVAVTAAAFDSLYQAHYGDVVAMLHALTGDLGEAQDLSQEAFFRAWQRSDGARRVRQPRWPGSAAWR